MENEMTTTTTKKKTVKNTAMSPKKKAPTKRKQKAPTKQKRKAAAPKSISLAGILVDSASACNGVWVNVMGPFDVLVARANNPKYRSVFQRLFTAALLDNKADGMDGLPDGVFDQVQTDAMAEAILVGWRGIHDDDGEIKYSVKRAIELLSDEDAYEIRSLIELTSVTRDNYVSADLETALGK